MLPSDILTEPSCLDRLPDEILQHVLDFAMLCNSPFYLEYCIHPTVRPSRTDESAGALQMEIYYRHSGTTSRLASSLHPCQAVHLADWIRINTTNRRIRRLGKESFFRNKTVAMKRSAPALLEQGSFTPHFNAADQALALRCIRDVVFVDNNTTSPGGFVQLPKLLSFFPKLKRCTLLIGFRIGEGAETVCKAWAQKEEGHGPNKAEMPPVFDELLHGIGVPHDITIDVAVCPGLSWAAHRAMLAQNVYPMLRIKTAMLQSQKDSEPAGHDSTQRNPESVSVA